MPFYRELFVNQTRPANTAGTPTVNSGTITESAILTGHRARPHHRALLSREIDPRVADPYAYFLSKSSQSRYHARLRERGLQPEGEPDRGHPFSLVKHSVLSQPYEYFANGNHFYGHYVVPKSSNTSVGNWANPPSQGVSGLDIWARDAYGKVAPSTVEWDAMQFLGELREGLPRLKPEIWKDRTNFARSASSDYLNATFGWAPLVGEVKAAATALAKASFALQGVNHRVHRRMEIPEVTSHVGDYRPGSTFYRQYAMQGLLSNSEAVELGYRMSANQQFGSGSLEWSELRSVRRWFEGEFTLFTPLGFNPDSFLDRLNQLVSLKLTPKVLWELTPWSWLVDWHLKVQDAIETAEKAANDLLIMHYGYAMQQVTITRRMTTRMSSLPKGVTGLPLRQNYLSRTVYKTRLRANPYGFGLSTGNGLTTQQWSILAALALTKSPGS